MKINSKTASSFNNNIEYCTSLQQLKHGMKVKLFTSAELVRMGIVKIEGLFMKIKVQDSDEESYYNQATVENYDAFADVNNEHGLYVRGLDSKDKITDVELETDENDWIWVNHQFIKLPD